jgi:hypothetical protein
MSSRCIFTRSTQYAHRANCPGKLLLSMKCCKAELSQEP